MNAEQQSSSEDQQARIDTQEEILGRLSHFAGEIIRVHNSFELHLGELNKRLSPVEKNEKETLDGVAGVLDEKIHALQVESLGKKDLVTIINETRVGLEYLVGQRYELTAHMFERDRAAYMETEDPRVRQICAAIISKPTQSTEAAA
jgi:hypothetical protein